MSDITMTKLEPTMTATDELRRMLDERGVEWKEHRHMMPGSMAIQRETLWGQPVDSTSGKPISHVYHYRATEMGDGRLFLEAQLIAPEQAIDATVGRGTCEADETETIKCWVKCKDESSTERMELIHVMECSECGHTYEHVNGDYEFCPRCGRRRVDE